MTTRRQFLGATAATAAGAAAAALLPAAAAATPSTPASGGADEALAAESRALRGEWKRYLTLAAVGMAPAPEG